MQNQLTENFSEKTLTETILEISCRSRIKFEKKMEVKNKHFVKIKPD